MAKAREPNLDKSLYDNRLTASEKALSYELSKRYRSVEHLDRDGSYGSCTTLRSKMAWLEGRGA